MDRPAEQRQVEPSHFVLFPSTCHAEHWAVILLVGCAARHRSTESEHRRFLIGRSHDTKPLEFIPYARSTGKEIPFGTSDSVTGIERLYELTDPVLAKVNVDWVRHGDAGPAAFIRRHIDRIGYPHVFLNTDVNHTVSTAWIEQQLCAGSVLAALILLLAEVAGVIRQEAGDNLLAQQIVTSLESHPQLRLVPLPTSVARLAAQLAATLSLRGADAIYATVARRLHVPLVSWDGQHPPPSQRVDRQHAKGTTLAA